MPVQVMVKKIFLVFLTYLIKVDNMKLQHKTIAITGGGQGLGLTMAITFAKSGANIALIDLNEEQLQQSTDLIKETATLGVQVKHYVANVSNETAVETTF
jgi:3-oxoacyl-[acyl-carrier protein] reductase